MVHQKIRRVYTITAGCEAGRCGMSDKKLLTPLAIAEGVALLIFWIMALSGQIQEFDTIMFFEPEMTIISIGMAFVSGIWIGGTIEKYNALIAKVEP